VRYRPSAPAIYSVLIGTLVNLTVLLKAGPFFVTYAANCAVGCSSQSMYPDAAYRGGHMHWWHIPMQDVAWLLHAGHILARR
jgi:hypothetical protein